ncbi:MAG: LapA family protein [Limisphaerales bacterium]
MKNSPLTTILLAVLAISALLSVISCMRYISSTKEIRRLQNQFAAIQYRQNAFQALITDAAEYGKTHPKIGPLLEPFGFKRNAPGAPATPNK